MLKMKTRETLLCPIFGSPEELKRSVLPTYEDIVKYYQFSRMQRNTHGKQEPRTKDITEDVSKELMKIWCDASIPTLSFIRIVTLLENYYNRYRALLKPYKTRKNNQYYIAQLEEFRRNSKRLFDIAACKCKNNLDCHCKKSKKVPHTEQTFLKDQRTERKMIIGTVDLRTTRALRKREARKQSRDSGHRKRLKLNESEEQNVRDVSSDRKEQIQSGSDGNQLDCQESDDQSDDTDDESGSSETSDVKVEGKMSPKSLKKIGSLPSFARTCDRYGISDRSAAALASALLQDVGLISESDTTNVIDKNRVRRERKKARNVLRLNENIGGTQILSLYFDGRKDKTLTLLKSNENKSSCRKVVTETEEHITLINEPGAKYVGHVTPRSGSASDIKEAICDFLQETNISTDELCVVGCDGTNVNTGKNGGIIRLIEVWLQKPMHWFICQLHSNELPLRCLMEYFDGPTTGPTGFSGPIGKLLQTTEKKPVVKFRAIKMTSPLPDVSVQDLSTDQKYLFDIALAVSSGNCCENLASRPPGKLSHARWITTANRILRLYVASSKPSSQLVSLTMFVMQVYVFSWFQIKCHLTCFDRPRNLFKTIRAIRYMPKEPKKVVETVIQRNGYFAHPENVLLSMLTDERIEIRELAVSRIKETRKTKQHHIRKFVIPVINFDCDDYTNLIFWNDVTFSETPLTFRMTDNDLDNHGQQIKFTKVSIPYSICGERRKTRH